MDDQYSYSDFETDSAEWFSKNKEEPFIYKMNKILYPNPEFLSESMPEDVDSKKIHMCIYCIDYTCVLPFVKYVLFPDETDKTVDLFELAPGQDPLDQLESLFVSSKPEILYDNAYKGFIDREDDIYMFFDITSLLESDAQLKPGFIYSVAHELCYLVEVQGNQFGKNIKNMFDKDDDTFPKCAILQPWFYNADGILEMIEVPQVMYICGDDLHALTRDELNDGLRNLNFDGAGGTLGTFLTTDCLIDYDDIGLHYYFTESIEDTHESYVRCIVFLMKIQKKHKNMDPSEYNTVSFAVDRVQYWGVKSIDQFVPI
jgi:hypothetical protein